jgi:hypothetical protein
MVLALLGSGVAADAGENAAELTLVYPCLPAPGPIAVDGRLDPAEWAKAIAVSGFTDSGSDELASEQVVMRLLYDRADLYVGVRCSESNLKGLKTPTTEHDGAFWNDDSIEIFLDLRHGHDEFVQLAATAGGVRYDAWQGDCTWNSSWTVAASQDAESWSLEVAIPFADLDAPAPTAGTLWGFNLCRERQAGGRLELANWADVRRVFNTVSRFGHLAFVGPDWQPTADTVAAAARGCGGAESRLYVADGYWRLPSGQAPQFLTYRALLTQEDQGLGPFLVELRQAYAKKPQLVLRQDFERLETAYGQARALVTDQGRVEAEAWAKTKAFLNGLQAKVETIYWRVRLAQLNEAL